jgi:hypothetical protein
MNRLVQAAVNMFSALAYAGANPPRFDLHGVVRPPNIFDSLGTRTLKDDYISPGLGRI